MQPEFNPDHASYPKLANAVLISLPLLTALLYYPGLAAPFFAAKAPAFFLGASLLTGLALLQFGLPRWSDTKLLIGFVVVVIASMSISRFGYMGRDAVMWYVEGPLLCWSAGILFRDRLDPFLKAVAIAGAAVAAITMFQFAIGHDFLFFVFGRSVQPVGGRLQLFATLGNPSFVASYLAACAPALLYCAEGRKGWTRFASGLALAFCVAGVVVTGSRGGLIALASGIALSLVLGPNRKRTPFLTLVALVLLAGVVFMAGHRNPRSAATSWTGRTVIWRATMADAWRHPLGSGPGTFAFLYPARVGSFVSQHPSLETYAGREEHALNDWVELWSDLGPFALFALLTLIIGFYRPSLARRNNPLPRTLAAMMTALLVASSFDSPLYRPETAMLFWICLAGGLTFAPSKFRIGSYARWVFAIESLLAGLFFAVVPTLASYHSQRGRDLSANSYYALAHSAYDRALHFDPTQTDARFGRMQTLALLQRYPEAMVANTDLLLWANEPEVWLYRAQIAHAMNNDDFAREQLRIAIRQFPYAKFLRDELSRFDTQQPSATSD